MTDNLKISNPQTTEDYEVRNALLASSLRDTPTSWKYESEYPLVLSPANSNTSWCLHTAGKIVAHANLWPRELLNLSPERMLHIGLIGNVATDPKHRGIGLMSAMFTHLEKTAQSQGIQALVLWSDLLEFYQNLGFSSIGREVRFSLTRNPKITDTGVKQYSAETLSDLELAEMLELRPKQEWSIQRSLDEFKALLRIPNTSLFIRRKNSRINAWLLIGKGSDMQGVIHEWGAPKAEELIQDIQSILEKWGIPELLLLTPSHLPHHWIQHFKQHCNRFTEHPMALALPTGHRGREAIAALNRCFIWGLDSI